MTMNQKQITFQRAIFILCAVAATVGAQVATDKKEACADDKITTCGAKVVQFLRKANERKHLNGVTEAQLKEWCETTKEALQCVNTTAQCKVDWNTPFNAKIFNTTRHYRDNVCTGNLRTEYLTHAPCLNNVTDANLCSTSNSGLLSSVTALLKTDNKNNNLCCYAQKTSICVKEKVKEKCSEEAAEFASKLELQKITPAFQDECGTNPCGDGAVRSQHEFTILATSIGFYIMFTLYH